MYKKVLFTQFAIPGYDSLEYRSNVHLAAGYLLGYVKNKFPKIEFVICPRIYTDILSEKAFVEYAFNQKPDLLVFSLYLWNIEKSFRVLKDLKNLLPESEFLFGGPEVNPDNDFLLSSDQFTQGIVGEGEVAFAKFLQGEDTTKIPGFLKKDFYNSSIAQRQDYKREANPYFQNLIEITPDTTLFFETVRGCPFTCSFCYYNKVYDKVVSVGTEQLEEIFEYAQQHNMDELFLLDPSFNIQANFNELLDTLIELNSEKKFKISTELRADYLTDEQIERLRILNVLDVEIGLQSTNPSALQAMRRKNSTEQTIHRTKQMIQAGINCKVDLIIGLPGDTIEGFKASVDAVVRAGIGESIQVFKLSLLSGTEFHKKRKFFGLSSQTKPPYHINSTATFSAQDMRTAIEYTQNALDITLYPIPAFILSTDFSTLHNKRLVQFDSDIRAVHKIFAQSQSFDFSLIENEKTRICETLVVHYLVSQDTQQRIAILKSLHFLSENFPDNTFQFVLDFRTEVDLKFIRQFAVLIPEKPPSYLDRSANSYIGSDLKLSSSFAVIVPFSFYKTKEYFALNEQCNLYLIITRFNEIQIETLYEESNFFFTGESQREAFKYLKSTDRLDEYTIFDSYAYELQKAPKESRVYKANMVTI